MSKYIHITATHNQQSPAKLLPTVLNLVKPQSVIDVGCGIGTFLAVLQKMGLQDVMGVEGAWLNPQMLEVDKQLVQIADLEKPLYINRKFDMAICLEVAEHLQESSAATIVQSLVGLSDIILFSAALPGQGGQNHINEQWPSYWQEKFKVHGYDFYDCFRSELWNDRDIQPWYKQNMFLVVKEGIAINQLQPVGTLEEKVHPEIFAYGSNNYHALVAGTKPLGMYLKLLGKAILVKLGLHKAVPTTNSKKYLP
jgi:SAM-dependent methyltransferase